MPTTSDERRKHERLSFTSDLMVTHASTAARAPADARDLSVAGMSFRTQLPLAVGQDVAIHLARVSEQAVIAATVRRVTAHGGEYVVGVEHVRRD